MSMKSMGPAILVIVAVLIVGAFVVDRWVLGESSQCAALTEPVDGLEGFTWTNGVTSSGPEWINVLTTGVTEADAPSRVAIASAVATDPEGFDDLLQTLPEDLRPAAERLQRVVVDAQSDRSAPEVEADVVALGGHASSACDIAL